MVQDAISLAGASCWRRCIIDVKPPSLPLTALSWRIVGTPITSSPSSAVGGLEDKPKEWDHPGKFKCKSCRATADKKNKLCKPTKVEKKAKQ